MRLAILLLIAATLLGSAGCRSETVEWEVVINDSRDAYDSILPASFRVNQTTRLTVRLSNTLDHYSAPTNLSLHPDSTTLALTTPSAICFNPLGDQASCIGGEKPEGMMFMVTPSKTESSSITMFADNIDTQNVFDYTATP